MLRVSISAHEHRMFIEGMRTKDECPDKSSTAGSSISYCRFLDFLKSSQRVTFKWQLQPDHSSPKAASEIVWNNFRASSVTSLCTTLLLGIWILDVVQVSPYFLCLKRHLLVVQIDKNSRRNPHLVYRMNWLKQT